MANTPFTSHSQHSGACVPYQTHTYMLLAHRPTPYPLTPVPPFLPFSGCLLLPAAILALPGHVFGVLAPADHLLAPCHQVDMATLDLSFISLRLVLPVVVPLVAPGGCLVVLVKPQFEAGPGATNAAGLVTSDKVRGAGRLWRLTCPRVDFSEGACGVVAL